MDTLSGNRNAAIFYFASLPNPIALRKANNFGFSECNRVNLENGRKKGIPVHQKKSSTFFRIKSFEEH